MREGFFKYYVYDKGFTTFDCLARCSDGQLRLTDRPEVTYGRVEICSHQRWNTFYSSNWFATNAKVACIELGFRGAYYYPWNLIRAT